MKHRKTIIAVPVLFFLLTLDAAAKPECSSRVMCGATCTYTELGGQCSGSSPNATSYCYREAVRSDYDVVVYSCHDGDYDYCCDKAYPY